MKRPYFILIILMLAGCGKNNKSAQVSDPEITIQAMRVDAKEGDVIYNLRIFPRKDILETNKTISKNMMYQVDSCFYLINDQKKIYASSTQNIANGVINSFEYLIRFDEIDAATANEAPLVYQDKYINQKNYQLLLK